VRCGAASITVLSVVTLRPKRAGVILVIRILRLLRVVRIFKLARYSRALQIFANTMARSLRELSMLSMFLLTGIIFFSTILHILEKVIDDAINLHNKDMEFTG
jgi:hypothetical protein